MIASSSYSFLPDGPSTLWQGPSICIRVGDGSFLGMWCATKLLGSDLLKRLPSQARKTMARHARGVLLGVAGAYVSESDAVDPRTTKVGGQAKWWPGSTPTEAQLTCCLCRQGPMRLLVQVYAPLHLVSQGIHVNERTLYVFACPNKSCHDQERGWKVFRSQVSAKDVPMDGCGEGMVPAIDGWADTSWENDGMEEAESMDDLVDALQSGASTLKVDEREPKLSRSTVSTSEDNWSTHTDERRFPEYYVVCEEEGSCTASNLDEEHVNALLERYRCEHPEDSAALTRGKEATTEWSGEQYEKGQSRSATSQFLKFLTRLEENPRQCIRYGFCASPLWPSAPVPLPDPCPVCLHDRVLEMQLMPALILDLMEAAEVYGLGDRTTFLQGIPSEWCTVGIWTCGRSCYGGQIFEESIKIANES